MCQAAVRLGDMAVSHELPQLGTGHGCTVFGAVPAPGHALLPAAVGIIYHSQLGVHAQQLIAQHAEHSLHRDSKWVGNENTLLCDGAAPV